MTNVVTYTPGSSERCVGLAAMLASLPRTISSSPSVADLVERRHSWTYEKVELT